ncbi:hypothetical protein [Burkholderia sp. SRS-W-2-2016]|uniref:hypothetical protein n=1 Tax=Burkholderia sp. SRS-W-2-2016 TaxID=1926878 RepID=UPI0015B9D136|nr:hypothetical protein [Burkholderia sp. SRS-W-2-2016]
MIHQAKQQKSANGQQSTATVEVFRPISDDSVVKSEVVLRHKRRDSPSQDLAAGIFT